MLKKIRRLFGRLDKEDDSELFGFESSSHKSKAQQYVSDEQCYDIALHIMSAVGGADNVEIADCCITRLRLKLYNRELVDEHALVDAGALGIIPLGSRSLHVVLGTHAQRVVDTFNEMLSLHKAHNDSGAAEQESLNGSDGCSDNAEDTGVEELHAFLALDEATRNELLQSMSEEERELYFDEIEDAYAFSQCNEENVDEPCDIGLEDIARQFKK